MTLFSCQRQFKTSWSFASIALLLLGSSVVHVFQYSTVRSARLSSWIVRSSTRLYMTSSDDGTDIEAYLNERYPAFMKVLSRNEKACKVLRESGSVGFTVFAPNDQAMMALGESKLSTLEDARNSETIEKIGAFHVINEPVRAEALFNAGGVVTMGGDVMIERSVSGGFFGVGGKEDGGVTINGAKVLSSTDVGSGVVHEMDGFISPSLLWRYMDQLRIPGSK